eukprot:4972631-Alexandrium_andersonii.AAC.1
MCIRDSRRGRPPGAPRPPEGGPRVRCEDPWLQITAAVFGCLRGTGGAQADPGRIATCRLRAPLL